MVDIVPKLFFVDWWGNVLGLLLIGFLIKAFLNPYFWGGLPWGRLTSHDFVAQVGKLEESEARTRVVQIYGSIDRWLDDRERDIDR